MDTKTTAAGADTEIEKPIDVDLNDIDAADEAEMTVIHNGKLTTWIWTFAGPGHPKAIAQSDRMSRERLQEEREQAQARVNHKKWKAEVETPNEVRKKNATYVVERLLRWTPVKLNGQVLEFSPEVATQMLMDPRKGTLLLQALEFINEDKSFTKRAATS